MPGVKPRYTGVATGGRAGPGGAWVRPTAGESARRTNVARTERMTHNIQAGNENGPGGYPGPFRLRSLLLIPCGRSAPASPSDPGRLRTRPYRPRRDCGSPQPGSSLSEQTPPTPTHALSRHDPDLVQ